WKMGSLARSSGEPQTQRVLGERARGEGLPFSERHRSALEIERPPRHRLRRRHVFEHRHGRERGKRALYSAGGPMLPCAENFPFFSVFLFCQQRWYAYAGRGDSMRRIVSLFMAATWLVSCSSTPNGVCPVGDACVTLAATDPINIASFLD